jgi:hypothetical protein
VHDAAPDGDEVPAAHGAHDDAPASEYVPALQAVQVAAPAAENVPAPHCVHIVAPAFENVPGLHVAHVGVVPPVENCPAGHEHVHAVDDPLQVPPPHGFCPPEHPATTHDVPSNV